MIKTTVKKGLLALILMASFACKKKENEVAEKRITALENYVDSLKTLSSEDFEKNWDSIANGYDRKNSDASLALSSLDEQTKTASQERIKASNSKYDEFKANMKTKANTKEIVNNPSSLLRDRLFGAGKVGTDMSFDWVNKDNILSVYQKFFEAYKVNKENFSREDFDEVKLLYEALDNHKNTVEREGLSKSDNREIAAIKFKFAPMFKVNRIGAKARETSNAKE